MRTEKLSGAKLRPLVQLLPALAVAAAVLGTLPRTRPVLAEVPERLDPIAVQAAALPEETTEEEPEEEEALPALPYADGVYTGSSRGFGGRVRVQVTMENGRITDLKLLDASHETPAFLRRAKRLLTTVLTEQTWEVDAVSEATYTSRGILGAIRNALTGEVVNNPLPPQAETPAPESAPVEEPFTPPSAYRDGVYTASAEGFGGPITVQVTLAGDTITDITVLDHAGETSSYYYKARSVIASILEQGTPEVDAVSGATYSSTGILNAVKLALSKAAAQTDPAEETPESLPADSGTGEAAASEPPAESVPAEPAESAPADPASPAGSEPAAPEAQPEETPAPADSLREWAQDLWARLFPEQSADSTSEVVFRALPPDSEPAVSAAEPAPDAGADSQTEPEGGEAE